MNRHFPNLNFARNSLHENEASNDKSESKMAALPECEPDVTIGLKENDRNAENVEEMPIELSWGKSLKYFPHFTIKEIEKHRLNSGKQKGAAISKTLMRGRKFKEERYLSSDSVFTAKTETGFAVKCKCRASMKKVTRSVIVYINYTTGIVDKAHCNCPAGNSGVCNHVIALLLELAEYSLNGLQCVPEEITCTSRLRKWGVPGQNTSQVKESVMNTSIQKSVTSKGIKCTVYDPRLNYSKDDFERRTKLLQTSLMSVNEKIPLAQCLQQSQTLTYTSTRYGEFAVGSPLSYQLQAVEFNFKILSNIKEGNRSISSTPDSMMPGLPLVCIKENDKLIPTDWDLSQNESSYLKSIQVSMEEALKLEKETTNQSQNPKWMELRKQRITSTKAHSVFIRKRNHKTLVEGILHPKERLQLPRSVQENLKHGSMNEPIAREKYSDVLCHKFHRRIAVRETGIVIQPNLFWLGASPDGLVNDNQHDPQYGLIEIKCPRSKRDCTPDEMVSDAKFYVGIEDGKPYLKKNHSVGYYSQIQMAMGLSQVKFCDFIVYTFKSMIIIRIEFDEQYFENLMKKLNTFYRNYMLPELMQQENVL